MVIAIDGTAGSGKGTVTELLAKELNFTKIDTGAMYRAITWEIIQKKVSLEDIERIKEPFYTTKKNGTGLGVSLSYEIINAHSGKLEYFSKENVGTKVVITLPIYEILD